jgi:catechol 2,3-dioxygenase-like lactoylglutathione lyase family enzyme
MEKMLLMSHCAFPTNDIIRTSEYYEKVMGFRALEYLYAKETHICLYRDSTEIILIKSNGQQVIPNRELYGYGYDAYFITSNQEQLQEELSIASAKIIRQLCHTDYDNKEFVVENIDGRWIGFGMKVD